MKKIVSGAAALLAVMLLAFTGCSSDDNGGGSGGDSERIDNVDGTTTLNIQENGDGFVSSSFSTATTFPGYTGTAYLDGGTAEYGNIVYTVSATETITDAKIAIHYLCSEVSRVRGAFVSVNGTIVNPSSPLAMTTDAKVKATNCTSENWKDTAILTGITLNAGSNSIIVTGVPAGTYTAAGGTSITVAETKEYLNYVDYLIVNGKGIDYGTDTQTYVSFSYASENTTAGTVSSETSSGNIATGTSVTVTAEANEGWEFECWSDGTKDSTYTFTVTDTTRLWAHFIPTGYTASSDLIGYGTLTADSADATYTICGGAGAAAANNLTITTFEELTSTYSTLISSDTPAYIVIKGTIDTSGETNPLLSVKVDVGSNKTIIGDSTGGGRLRNIGLVISGQNIIVRNMKFGEVISWDGYTKSGADDAFSLNEATHVWVDHCEFQSHLTPQDLDGNEITEGHDYYFNSSKTTAEKWKKDFYDGLFDVKNGSSWITVSNCYFHDHWKACLCSSGDSKADKNTITGATDEDMRITFYNNYWKDINARQPLFRWGKAHIFNSYFYSESSGMSGQSTGINCRAGSEIYIDHNTFKNIKTPIGFYNDDDASSTGFWVDEDNTFDNCTNSPGTSATSYEPPYTWTPKSASEAKDYVLATAGVTSN